MPISTVSQKGLDAPLTLTSPVLTTPNLGTPSALVLTNATGTPAAINLTNATSLPKAALPTGSVLQVVQTIKTDTFTTTVSDATFVDVTGMSVIITPTSASNKILVMVNVGKISVQAQGRTVNFMLDRNGTLIGLGDAAGSRLQVTFGYQTAAVDSTGRGGSTASYTILDSPATTSPVTYKLQMSGHDGDLTVINRSAEDLNSNDAPQSRTSSTIIVMEIAA